MHLKLKFKRVIYSFMILPLFISCGGGGDDAIPNPQREALRSYHTFSFSEADDLEVGFNWSDIINMFSGEKPVSEINPANGTLNGECGGSVDLISDSSVDSTGKVIIRLEFEDYDDCETILSGDIIFSANLNPDTNKPEICSISFSSLHVSTGSDSYEVNNSVTNNFFPSRKLTTNDLYLVFDNDDIEYIVSSFGLGWSSVDGIRFVLGEKDCDPNAYAPGEIIVGFTGHTIEEAEDLILSYGLIWETTVVNMVKGLIQGQPSDYIDEIKSNDIVSAVQVIQGGYIWVYFNNKATKKAAEELVNSFTDIDFDPIIYRDWGVINVPEGEEQEWIEIFQSEPIVNYAQLNMAVCVHQ